MKNLFTKAIMLASLIHAINPVYSKGIIDDISPFRNEDGSSYSEDPEYPLLESQNIINLITKTWGTIREERTIVIGNTILDLLLTVSNEVREVDAETVLGADPAVFADSIISGVEEIRSRAFDNVQREIDCIWGYADKVIRYLGTAKYTITG